MKRGRAQDKVLLNLIADNSINTHSAMTKTELKIILDKVRQETNTILRKDTLETS